MQIGFFEKTKNFKSLAEKDYKGLTIYDFIHGYCETFAVLLWSKYGWQVKKAYANGHLVHAFCSANDLLIDVRGATNNKEEFWTEFSRNLFGFAEKANYDKIYTEDADEQWIVSIWAKEYGDMSKEFASARAIDEKFDFWRKIATI